MYFFKVRTKKMNELIDDDMTLSVPPDDNVLRWMEGVHSGVWKFKNSKIWKFHSGYLQACKLAKGRFYRSTEN